MAKFNLNSLPRCGAKTRNGNPCQRFGNKINGRCKLHGGRSTGAKTKEGKLAVKLNPLFNAFTWYFNTQFDLVIKQDDANIAIAAYFRLIELSGYSTPDTYTEMIEVVKACRTELEALKYYIAEYDGTEALLLIQSALDHYYKDTDSNHLHFHVYTTLFPTPYFKKLISKAQFRMMDKLNSKTRKKKGEFYSGRVKQSPEMKKLKKYVKDLKFM